MTDKPRILALFGSAILFGQERGNMEALCALRDLGGKVLCLIRDEQWNTVVPPGLDAVKLDWRKVPYIEQKLPGRMRWFLFRNPIAFLKANWTFLRIAFQFKPTHVHAFNLLYTLNFWLALSVTRIPLVFRAGDTPVRHNWFWRWLWRQTVRRATTFVANSQFLAKELVNSGVPSEKISVIYGVPPRRGDIAQSFSPPKNCSNTDIVFAYIGRITAEKGVDVLIDAFRSILQTAPAVRLLIAGRISDWQGDAWARALKARTLEAPILNDRVAFLGEVEDVPGLLKFSSVHVCPTIGEESFANVVLEAKSAKRASIVFPSGGLPEMVSNGVDGMICAEKTSASLAKAMRYYVDHSEFVRCHGIAAGRSLDRLGINRFQEKWASVYGVRR